MSVDMVARAMSLNFQSKITKPQLCGIYENTSHQYMDICIDKNIVFAAIDAGGVQRIDFSTPENPIKTHEVDIAPSPMQTYSIIKDGNYLYTATRTSGANPTTSANMYLNFDGGDADLSDGGDGWDTGYKSTNATIIGNAEHSPLGGLYGALINWTAGNSSAYCQKAISGKSDNYVEFWAKIGFPTTIDGSSIRFSVMSETNNLVYQIAFAHKTDKNNILPQMMVMDSTNTIQTVSATQRLSYDTWYLFKCYYKIDGVVGGGVLQYKANIGDAWTTLCSKLDMNTTLKTPTLLKMGLAFSSASYTTGKIYFDEVFFDIVDLDTKIYDEGKVDCLNASDLTTVSTIWFNGKCSDIFKLDNWLLVANQKSGVAIVDATNPSNLQLLGHWGDSTGTRTETQGIVGYNTGLNKYLYIINYFKGLTILDITDPKNIVFKSTIDFSNNYATCWNAVVKYPYLICTKSVAVETVIGTSNDQRGIVVYDVSNPSNPIQYEFELPATEKDTWNSGDSDARPTRIALNGNDLYVANGSRGISKWDVTDPKNAIFISSFGANDNASMWAVAVDKFNRIFTGSGRHTGGTKYLYMYRQFM